MLFSSLGGDHSDESNIVIFGRVLFRDGVIHCRGYLMDHRCGKIQRLRRSSLSAECHSAVTAGDFSLWYQVILVEIFTHSHQIRRLCPPTECPMLNPFSDSPPGGKLKADKLFWAESELRWNPAAKLQDADAQWNCGKCDSRQVCIPLQTTEAIHWETEAISFNPLLLTDCCSLFSSILRIQPNDSERCPRIILAHLRDLQALIAISFIDASVNIGDAGTKHGGNNSLLLEFTTSGGFIISFVGRKGQPLKSNGWMRRVINSPPRKSVRKE